MLQFLKENGLQQSFMTLQVNDRNFPHIDCDVSPFPNFPQLFNFSPRLQEETEIALNSVDNTDQCIFSSFL